MTPDDAIQFETPRLLVRRLDAGDVDAMHAVASRRRRHSFRCGCWGRGYAPEVESALLAHGARRHGLRRGITTVAPDNAASQRLLAKAGMARGALCDNADGTRTQLFAWMPPPG
jgi:hypothetical protein